MSLIFALIALNLAFGLYLFLSLRRSPEGFLDKSSFGSKPKQQVARSHQFYDAFSGHQPQLARVRSNTSQY
jgi:hypothetical protein